MIGPYFDTKPCDTSILGYMLSGLLYPRVWVLEEQTRTRKPDGYEVYPIKKPAGIEFSLCPHLIRAKTHRYCSNFQPNIRRTKHDLIVNLITRMDGKSRDESIKPN